MEKSYKWYWMRISKNLTYKLWSCRFKEPQIGWKREKNHMQAVHSKTAHNSWPKESGKADSEI